MKLTVAQIDYTQQIFPGSLSWNRYDVNRSALSVTLAAEELTKQPLVGEEIMMYTDDETVPRWKGIVTEVEQQLFPERYSLYLKARGYEHLAERKCVVGHRAHNVTPEVAVMNTVFLFLSEDGVMYGTVDESGIEPETYIFNPSPVSSIIDALADNCGARWWVDQNKLVQFRNQLPITDAGVCVDLDGETANRLTDVGSIKYRFRGADYHNVQYFIGANNLTGEAQLPGEVKKMAQRYGSGEYGKVTRRDTILTRAGTQQAAKAKLSEPTEGEQITFTTFCDHLELFQTVPIRARRLGIENFRDFVITRIEAEDLAGRLHYTVTLSAAREEETV